MCVCVCVCVYVCMRKKDGGGGWGKGAFRGCEGGAEGSVTDNHLAPVARAARVVPLLQWHVMGGRFPPVFIQNLKALKHFRTSQLRTKPLLCDVDNK